MGGQRTGNGTVFVSRCAAGNAPSNAIPRRLGFTLEGVEREGELMADGQYVDLNVYSILKREIENW